MLQTMIQIPYDKLYSIKRANL